jgi:DNA-directed RNA polymerase specialized sigma24 family protein
MWRGRRPVPAERTSLSDEEWPALLAADPERGWRAFIDTHTPTLLALIERAGVDDRDEAMDIYTRVCERLSEHNHAALRRRDPAAGSLTGWLAVVVRRAAVDYVRSQLGRRRIFASVRSLDRFHQRLFELYYWHGRTLSEAAEMLRAELKQEVSLEMVLDGIEAVDRVLSERHRCELVSLVARSRPPASLEHDDETTPDVEPIADSPDPEAAMRVRELEDRLNRTLATLPPEDAAIVSLKYVEGLSRPQIQRLLRLPELTEHRVRTIVATLRSRLVTAEHRAAANG